MSHVEFHFDFGSPNAYLAHLVLPAIEARTGVAFLYTPVLLGAVFKATGNRSPMEANAGIANKLRYQDLEIQRFLKRHAITQFRPNPHFPVNTLAIMRGALAAKRLGQFDPYVRVIFSAMWEQGRKMDATEVILQTLNEAGLHGENILSGAQDREVKDELIASTNASVARGTFGSPTFFVGEEIFFGKDSLGEVERAIEERTEAERTEAERTEAERAKAERAP